MFNGTFMTPAEAMAWLNEHAARLVIPAGAIALLTLVVLIGRALKRGKGDTLATGLAVTIATAFSAEGMFEVATERLGLSTYFALALFTVAEAAMLAEAVRAGRLHKRTGSLGIHGRAVWTIAVCAGVIVSLNSASVVEFPIRLGMPILVAGLWWLGYQTQATRERLAGAISWTVSPRRVLVWLRLADPGDVTVSDAATERLTKRMTVAGFKLHIATDERAKARRTLRLQLMALKASDEVADEVVARIGRAYAIVDRTAPGAIVIDDAEQAKADKRAQDRQDRRVRDLVRREVARLEASAVMPVSPGADGPRPLPQGIYVPSAAEVAKLAA